MVDVQAIEAAIGEMGLREFLALIERLRPSMSLAPTCLALAAYVSADDINLDRRTFLQFVRDRIDDDLNTFTQGQF